MKLHIANEYDPLEVVLVHRPGDEIERLTNENMRSFLFEDIPYLARMQDEHDEFVDEMRDRGIRVVYLQKLLKELIEKNPVARDVLIDQSCAAEQATGIAHDLKDRRICPDDRLMTILFSGLTHGEYQEMTGRPALPGATARGFILRPIPNAYFSRDPAVVFDDVVISCKMHYVERVRETILTRAVLEHHPDFTPHKIIYGATDSPREDRPFTIEGGDVIVLNDEAVLVGVSERTRSETVSLFARKCFEEGHVRRFYEIPIPTERAFMHLDTVFGIVNRGVVVWFPGVMDAVKNVHFYEQTADGVVRKEDTRDLPRLLSDEFGQALTVVSTGGGDEIHASREQRMDGTNILAIAPGVACTYERNARTIKAMEKAGIECVKIVGSELIRGLGGPRCMTMPLRRKASAAT